MGGDTDELHKWLKATRFSIDKLDNCELLVGDSAGAYVLGRHVLVDYEPDGSLVEIRDDGFVQDENILVFGHVNNPRYHQKGLRDRLDQYAQDVQAKTIALEENQAYSQMK